MGLVRLNDSIKLIASLKFVDEPILKKICPNAVAIVHNRTNVIAFRFVDIV